MERESRWVKGIQKYLQKVYSIFCINKRIDGVIIFHFSLNFLNILLLISEADEFIGVIIAILHNHCVVYVKNFHY